MDRTTLDVLVQNKWGQPMEKRRHKLVYQLIEALRLFGKPKWFVGSTGLNLAEFMILDFLAERERCIMKDIVLNFSLAASTATVIVNRLVKKNYVKREHSEEDRRMVFLEITPEGQQAHNNFWTTMKASIEKPLSHLTEVEIETLSRLIKKLTSLMNKSNT